MRLAMSEGRLTKWRELYDELTPRDVAYLNAFHQIEPWGDARDDIRHAIMTSVVAKAFNGAEVDVAKLANYISGTNSNSKPGDKPAEETKNVSPEAAAAMFRQQHMRE